MTAQDQFNKFVTDGKADSIPVNTELTQEEKTVVNDKGYKTTLITTGFKLSIPNTYSSVEHSETVEVYGEVDIKQVKDNLIRDVANHTYVAATQYLKTLIEKVK